jgi:hypothetical protein
LRYELGLDLVAHAPPRRAPRSRLPADTVDPFPTTVDRPPEIGAGELDVELLRGALLHHGCVLVHDFFSTDHIQRLRDDIDQLVAGYQRWVDSGQEVSTPPWYEPFESAEIPVGPAKRIMGGNLGTWYGPDSPRGLLHVLDAFADAGLPELVADYLDEPACFALEKTALRRVPNTVPPAWHQDGFAFGTDTGLLNVWVTLSDCGVDAPSLGLIPTRVREIFRAKPDAPIPWDLDHDEVLSRVGGVPFVELVLRPGDALIFDEMLLHGTVVDTGMPKPRYCTDAWFFPVSEFRQEGYLPFAYVVP